jgi:hypothetical protein
VISVRLDADATAKFPLGWLACRPERVVDGRAIFYHGAGARNIVWTTPHSSAIEERDHVNPVAPLSKAMLEQWRGFRSTSQKGKLAAGTLYYYGPFQVKDDGSKVFTSATKTTWTCPKDEAGAK